MHGWHKIRKITIWANFVYARSQNLLVSAVCYLVPWREYSVEHHLVYVICNWSTVCEEWDYLSFGHYMYWTSIYTLLFGY